MDMHMPHMDGLTATRKVCERWSRERRPRIIALSASELPEDRARWLAAGADGWVSKSLPEEDIRRVLAGSAGSRLGPARPVPRRAPGNAAAPTPEGGAARRREPSELSIHVMEIFLRDAASQLAALRDAWRSGTAGPSNAWRTPQGERRHARATSVARSFAELIQCARHRTFEDGPEIVARLEAQVAAIEQTLTPRPPAASEAAAGPEQEWKP